MSQEGQMLKLPSKIIRGRRANGDPLIKNMFTRELRVNGYEISLRNAYPNVFKYELKIYACYGEDRERDLSRGPKNDASNILRHQALFNIVVVMLRHHTQAFGDCTGAKIAEYIYDCGINFYSKKKLCNEGQEAVFEIPMEKLADETINYMGRRYTTVIAKMILVEEIDLRSTAAVSEALDKRNRSVVQFIEILSNQWIYHQKAYYIFAQKMFVRNTAKEIQVADDNCKVIKAGMDKSVRFVGDNLDQTTPILMIDPKKSLFFKEQDLGNYICNFLGCRPENLDQQLGNQMLLRKLKKELKNLVVVTKHLEKNYYISIHDISPQNARNHDIEINGERMTVQQYFENRYHIRVKYPDLPLIVERKNKREGGSIKSVPTYHLIELLVVVPGQRVPLDKMNPRLTEQMIRNCQAKPTQYVVEMEQQRAEAKIQNVMENFKAYGIEVTTNIKHVNGEVLFPPAIGYGNNDVTHLPIKDRENRDDVAWRDNGKKFWRPAEGDMTKVWVAVLFQRGIPGNMLKEFVQGFTNAARQCGLNLLNCSHQENIDRTDKEFVLERMKFFKGNGARFVLFFTKDKMDDVHHVMKQIEVETGIVTQHICEQTVKKVASGKGANLVYGNLLKKTNLKLGGVNWDIGTSGFFKKANNSPEEVFAQTWLARSRMFMGLDMSHAAPQSFHDRRAGVPPSQPTVVGMAYTVGHPVAIRGTYLYQTPREHIIEHLTDHIVEAFGNYQGYNKDSFPKQLIVYRSGISEGEFAKVITKEVGFFHAAWVKIKSKFPNFKEPQLVIVVVQKTSNYRIVPLNINPNDQAPFQNVQSGTVVDREVLHPTQTEFLLVPHKAIQGTAHPIKCTLVYDDGDDIKSQGFKRLSLEEIEYVTNTLCYAHGIVASPVSVPAPLYSAGDLAKRGRNNWRIFNGSDDTSVSSGSDGGRHKNTGDPHFWINITQSLKPRIMTKYWA